ncbi:MAG: GTPase HflX [Sedimentisphaerales bacterium]|nr:GTPase HflX [Sedimentisphaerales bacterium]
MLVHLALPKASLGPAESLDELASLAEAAGADVVWRMYQKRRTPSAPLYVGKGKAEQIAEQAKKVDADVVIFDNDLSPAQIRELEKIINCKVIDRSELILDIFASRARTHEARLQVELAQLEYTFPRLTRMWSHLDTVVGAAGGAAGAVGGIGTRGPGEKQLEIDRRLVNKRLTVLRRELEHIDRRKQRLINSRSEHFTVSLVGYTNAGKSTLLKCLTGINVYIADQLFATLDTKTTRWNLDRDIHVLLSDTVGFVRDLPHHLVASFRATLEETLNADLLLHVVDVSHPQAEIQLHAVNRVLKEIGCNEKDILLVFNKIDRPVDHLPSRSVRDTLMTLYPDALCVSARTGQGVDNLHQVVLQRVTGQKLHLRITCSYNDGRAAGFLRAHGEIISENYTENDIILEAWLGQRQLPGLQRLNPRSCDILCL